MGGRGSFGSQGAPVDGFLAIPGDREDSMSNRKSRSPKSLRAAISAWRKGERGASEIVAALFFLPLSLAMILVLLDAGFYMQTRSNVDVVLQDTVRSVAVDGGNNNPRTNRAGIAWSTRAEQTLRQMCTNGTIRCDRSYPINVVCTPTVANSAGDTVRCSASIRYQAITFTSDYDPNASASGTDYSLGFSGLFSRPITFEVSSIASVGLN